MRPLPACLLAASLAIACGGEASTSTPDAGPADGATAPDFDAARPVAIDGGYAQGDGGTVRADRFATSVESFTPGECAGFGAAQLPDVVLGPPVGAGTSQGSTDVVSLGRGGSIVLGFGGNAIVDGPGPDFVVFENAFWIGGDATHVYAEPAEVAVSEDGVTFRAFPCASVRPPFDPTCAGLRPVYASPSSGVSAVSWPACGGDAFDLSTVGVPRARFVRVRDLGWQDCPTDPKQRTTTNGFDLDAIAILNADQP